MLERLFPSGLGDPAIATALARAGVAAPSGDGLIEVVGCCLWDIVSKNHQVTDTNGQHLSLGSFRAAGEAIAEFVEQHAPDGTRGWDYMDFYLGSRWPRPPADVAPLYQAIYSLIFERMRATGFDWLYRGPHATIMQVPETGAPLPPEMQALGLALDEVYRKAEGALDDPPPIIAAYRSVYGKTPGTAI
jgi:hypothetical protein